MPLGAPIVHCAAREAPRERRSSAELAITTATTGRDQTIHRFAEARILNATGRQSTRDLMHSAEMAPVLRSTGQREPGLGKAARRLQGMAVRVENPGCC